MVKWVTSNFQELQGRFPKAGSLRVWESGRRWHGLHLSSKAPLARELPGGDALSMDSGSLPHAARRRRSPGSSWQKARTVSSSALSSESQAPKNPLDMLCVTYKLLPPPLNPEKDYSQAKDSGGW